MYSLNFKKHARPSDRPGEATAWGAYGAERSYTVTPDEGSYTLTIKNTRTGQTEHTASGLRTVSAAKAVSQHYEMLSDKAPDSDPRDRFRAAQHGTGHDKEDTPHSVPVPAHALRHGDRASFEYGKDIVAGYVMEVDNAFAHVYLDTASPRTVPVVRGRARVRLVLETSHRPTVSRQEAAASIKATGVMEALETYRTGAREAFDAGDTDRCRLLISRTLLHMVEALGGDPTSVEKLVMVDLLLKALEEERVGALPLSLRALVHEIEGAVFGPLD